MEEEVEKRMMRGRGREEEGEKGRVEVLKKSCQTIKRSHR
jgi:hypothetical protein